MCLRSLISSISFHPVYGFNKTNFLSFNNAGQSPVFCGRSGKQLKRRHSSQRGMLLDDWSRIVKNLNVSSSVNQASRLIDGSEQCWQSSGSQGKVTSSCNVYFGILSFHENNYLPHFANVFSFK